MRAAFPAALIGARYSIPPDDEVIYKYSVPISDGSTAKNVRYLYSAMQYGLDRRPPARIGSPTPA